MHQLELFFFEAVIITTKGKAKGLYEFIWKDESFATRADDEDHALEYVKKEETSLLEKSGLGMVSHIPIDPMHLLDQGVGKVILNAIVRRQISGGPRTACDLLQLKSTFAQFHRYTPSDFARKTGSLDEIPRFKATEVRQFLLYTGVVLASQYLSPSALEHFHTIISCTSLAKLSECKRIS